MSELEFAGFVISNMLSSKTGPALEPGEHAEGHSLGNKGLSWQGGKEKRWQGLTHVVGEANNEKVLQRGEQKAHGSSVHCAI